MAHDLLLMGDGSFPKRGVPKAGQLVSKLPPRSGALRNRSWKDKYILKKCNNV
jgi:hypothetical protein